MVRAKTCELSFAIHANTEWPSKTLRGLHHNLKKRTLQNCPEVTRLVCLKFIFFVIWIKAVGCHIKQHIVIFFKTRKNKDLLFTRLPQKCFVRLPGFGIGF